MPSAPLSNFSHTEYSSKLYKDEISHHRNVVDEYNQEIYNHFLHLLSTTKPNLELYQQQPFLTFSIRSKLIDFLLKMSTRLKIIPFVFYKAVKIFDRYCSKRVILLDQSQLIITTCLWIASKVQGGNNHFINLNNIEKLDSVTTINDLGYGCGGKYLGPTERFRLPKLHELVKLCGEKCKYDQSMFKQMELHILQTLDWSFNEPGIEEFIMKSNDFNIINKNEFFKIKEFLSYLSLYSSDLIDIDMVDLSKVIIDLINETFNLNESDYYYQTINKPDLSNGYSVEEEEEEFFIEGEERPSLSIFEHKIDYNQYKFIKKHMIKSILGASDFILKLFNSKGPQYLFHQVLITYKDPFRKGVHDFIQPPSQLVSMPPISTSTSSLSPTSPTSTMSMSSPLTPTCTTPITPTHPQMPHSTTIYKPTPISSNSANMANMAATSTFNNGLANNSSFKKYHATIGDYSMAVPRIITNYSGVPSINSSHHHHNSSQASINSSFSKDTEYSIFETDSRRNGVYTPMSDEESPIFHKPHDQHNYHSFHKIA